MLVPAANEDPITVAGLGLNVTAALTIRFGEEEDKGEEGEGSDGRQAPGGDANGVIAKINGADRVVKSGMLKVWTRDAPQLEIARAGAGEQTIQVKDGDRVRLRVRSAAVDGSGDRPKVRVAVFVGDEWVGTTVVSTATSAEEETEANDALDAAKAFASAAANVSAADAANDAHAPAANSSTDATPVAAEDTAAPSPGGYPGSRITGRPVLAEGMARAPRGVTRVVAVNETITLPTKGYLVVAGVLPSADITLRVQAFEEKGGADVFAKQAAEDEALAKVSAMAGVGGEEDRWRAAKLGVFHITSTRGGASGGNGGGGGDGGGDGGGGGEGGGTEGGLAPAPADAPADAPSPLSDWVEVHVEGDAVTPPVSVWLARRISVRVTAAPVGGVARRVVIRAGEQTWMATIAAEALEEEGSAAAALAPAPALAAAFDLEQQEGQGPSPGPESEEVVAIAATDAPSPSESPSSPPPPPSPPPPFPPIDAMLRAAGGGNGSDTRMCNATEEGLRTLATDGVVKNRTDIYEYDEANATPNLCGAAPACDPRTSEGSRDVVFVVDTSEAIGDELFYGGGGCTSRIQC